MLQVLDCTAMRHTCAQRLNAQCLRYHARPLYITPDSSTYCSNQHAQKPLPLQRTKAVNLEMLNLVTPLPRRSRCHLEFSTFIVPRIINSNHTERFEAALLGTSHGHTVGVGLVLDFNLRLAALLCALRYACKTS